MVTLTITGANDAPTLEKVTVNGAESAFAVPVSGGGLTASIVGTAVSTFNGQLVANDPDQDDIAYAT